MHKDKWQDKTAGSKNLNLRLPQHQTKDNISCQKRIELDFDFKEGLLENLFKILFPHHITKKL